MHTKANEAAFPPSLCEALRPYYAYTRSPLGQLFYKTVFSQLDRIQNQTVLDFGSGFGYTAAFLAQQNRVTAVEADAGILAASKNAATYSLLHGGLEVLKSLPSEHFDVVVCHLVLEFVQEPAAIVAELCRVLKKGGLFSAVRHNRAGRVLQAVVQEYQLEEAVRLLQGEPSHSSAFGAIRYYTNENLVAFSHNKLTVQNVYGVRVLASLHETERMHESGWLQDMLALEKTLSQHPDFVRIAFFQHILLTK